MMKRIPLGPLTMPSWLKHPVPSTWNFTTSNGGEFDALFVAASSGSFFVVDSRDPDHIVHELLFVGAGATTGELGGSFSTPDMFSEGVGPIGMIPGRSSLALSDFGGSGLILSMAAGLG